MLRHTCLISQLVGELRFTARRPNGRLAANTVLWDHGSFWEAVHRVWGADSEKE